MASPLEPRKLFEELGESFEETPRAAAIDLEPAPTPSAPSSSGPLQVSTAVSPIFSAVAAGDYGLLQRLLETRANANALDEHGETALFEAAIAGSLPMVATLLWHGANPLHRAPEGSIVRELLTKGPVLTLLELFEDKDVDYADRESMFDELSQITPRTSRRVESQLDAPGGISSRFTSSLSGPPELSGFYQDSKTTLVPSADSRSIAGGRPGGFFSQRFGLEASGTDDSRARALGRRPEHDILADAKQVFEVVKAKRCKVYAAPDLQSTVLTSKSRGACVHGMELTMNHWLRLLDNRDGWMLVDMQGTDGVRQVLLPKEGDMSLNLLVRTYQPQGLCCLEVSAATVTVHKVPHEEGQLVSTRTQGEYIYARSQSFNGWLRLVGEEGWVQGTDALKSIEEQPGMEDMDLWALSDVWATARRESEDGISQDMISTLKKLQEDCLVTMYTKLAACKPGNKDDYFALGLTADDLKLSRTVISRRLFVIILMEELDKKGLFKLSDLVNYKRPPLLREVIGVLECDSKDGINLYNLGPDSTVYDLESGRVFGLWNSDAQQILPMTHMSEFFRAYAPVKKEKRSPKKAGKEKPQPVAQPDNTVGSEYIEDVVDSRPLPIPFKAAITQDDLLEQALLLVGEGQLEEALSSLNQALAMYDGTQRVDLDFEREVLKTRAEVWYALELFDHVLADTERILALDCDEEGTYRRYHIHSQHEDEVVRSLRRLAFDQRRERKGTKEEVEVIRDTPPKNKNLVSLAEID